MNIKEIINLPSAKLKKVIQLKSEIERLQTQLEKVLGGAPVSPEGRIIRRRRPMSPETKRKIALAAKARWARVKNKK